jgi:hypothetical protein
MAFTDTDDDREQQSCIECGSAVGERVFALTDEIVLCHECALRRGGIYDDAKDKWKIAPRLEDIHAMG